MEPLAAVFEAQRRECECELAFHREASLGGPECFGGVAAVVEDDEEGDCSSASRSKTIAKWVPATVMPLWCSRVSSTSRAMSWVYGSCGRDA